MYVVLTQGSRHLDKLRAGYGPHSTAASRLRHCGLIHIVVLTPRVKSQAQKPRAPHKPKCPNPSAQAQSLFSRPHCHQIWQARNRRGGYRGSGTEAQRCLRERESNLVGVGESGGVDYVDGAVVGANEKQISGRT